MPRPCALPAFSLHPVCFHLLLLSPVLILQSLLKVNPCRCPDIPLLCISAPRRRPTHADSRFHASYLANFRRTNVPKVLGSRGRTVYGLHRDGHVFEFSLEVHEAAQQAQGGRRLFSGRIVLRASDAQDPRFVQARRRLLCSLALAACLLTTSSRSRRRLTFFILSSAPARPPPQVKISEDGDIITVSGNAKEILGVRTDELTAENIDRCLRWPDGACCACWLLSSLLPSSCLVASAVPLAQPLHMLFRWHGFI